MSPFIKKLLVITTLSFSLSLLAFSQLATAKESSHKKVIDFDDEVVEGLNKRPLDSLNQISEKDGKNKRPHLYRKRMSFNYEIQESIRTLQWIP